MDPRCYIVLALAGCAADAPDPAHFTGCLDACGPGQVAEVWAYANVGRTFALGADGALVSAYERELDWLDGDLAVTAHATFPSVNRNEYVTALALAPDGGAVVETAFATRDGDGALHALDATGGERWETTSSGELAVVARTTRVYLGSTYGDATIGGRALAAPFVAALDASSGAIAWTFAPPAPPAGQQHARTAIAALPDGGVLVGTQFTGGFDAGAIHLDAPASGAGLVVALSADGVPRWAAQITGTSDAPVVSSVAVGPGGEIAVDFQASGPTQIGGVSVDLSMGRGLALFGGDGALRFALGWPTYPLVYGGVTLATDGTTVYVASVDAGEDTSHISGFTAAGRSWNVTVGGEGDQSAHIIGLAADGLDVQIESQYDSLSESGDPPPVLELAGLKLHQRLAIARLAR